LEYYEHQGGALIQLRWDKINLPTPVVVATATPTPETNYFPDWRGEYWTNERMEGQPKMRRNDINLNFNWGEGSPASNIPSDNFSATWTRYITFKGAMYRFYASADDGIRVYLDNERVINEWHVSNGNNIYYAESYLEGEHKIKVEYFDSGGQAFIWFKIELIGQPTATATNTPISTATAMPTNTPSATTIATPTATHTPTPTPSSSSTPSATPTSSPTLVTTVETSPTDLPDSTPVEEPTATPTKANLLPTAIINSPLTTTVGMTMTLSGLNSFDKDGRVISYTWNFGSNNLSYGATVTYVYTIAGSYPVILTVMDNNGATNSTTAFIQVYPLPVAIIYAPPTAMISQTVWFSGTQSYSPNGFLKAWQWNLGNGVITNGAVISYTYVLTGQYFVTLRVTDTLNLSNQVTWPLVITTTR
jgi:hypothetical protein